jgi:hypothetical protein
MPVTILDTFPQADENPLSSGGNWDNSIGRPLQVVSHTLQVTSIASSKRETHVATIPADQWAQITLSTISGTALAYGGVLLRYASGATDNGYRITGQINPAATNVDRFAAGANTTIATATTTWQAGDILYATMVGSVLTVYQIRSGTKTQILQVTDTTYTSGRVGVAAYMDTGGVQGNIQLSSFAAGDLWVPSAGRLRAIPVPTPTPAH